MSLPQSTNVPDFFDDALPKFRLGELVKHARYGYRGVVVDFDVSCHADETWYHSNKTQPERSQPWYHVIVDGSASSTYVAQSNLTADPAAAPVHHPLMGEFFEAFDGASYHRNDAVWPSW